MSEPFQRVHECGCTETWTPYSNCDGDKAFTYTLLKCPPHWQGDATRMLIAQEKLRETVKRMEGLE